MLPVLQSFAIVIYLVQITLQSPAANVDVSANNRKLVTCRNVNLCGECGICIRNKNKREDYCDTKYFNDLYIPKPPYCPRKRHCKEKSPCTNQGKCYSTFGSYFCQCTIANHGQNCELRNNGKHIKASCNYL